MNMLLIDTSGAVCQAGLAADGVLVAESRLFIPRAHARMLPLLTQSVLDHADCRCPDAVAVIVGPGSFTGVRVGVAFAQGFAQAHGLPMVGVNTLAALAAPYADTAGALTMPVAAWLDARADRLYAQHYRPGEQPWHLPGQAVRVPQALEALAAFPQEAIAFVGDGACAHAPEITAAMGRRAQLPTAGSAAVSLYAMAAMAFVMFQTGNSVPAEQIEPYYL